MLEQVVKPPSSGSILPWLTASRIVTTNSLSQLATPSSISSDQSLTLSGTATATVAGLITAQSGLTVSSNAAVSGTGTVTGLLTASSALTVASTVTLTLQTASRILTTSSTSTVASPSAISTAQTLTLSATTGTTLTVSSAQDSSSKDTGAIVTEGGVGIEKSLYVGGAVDVTSTVTAASFFRCNRTNSFDTTYCTFFTGCSTFPFFFDATGGMNWGDGTNPVDTILYRGAANQIRTTDQLYVQFSNDSTSVTTGAIFTDGGIGVGKRLTLDGATGKTLRIVNGVANASVATTLGSVGPTGSTAGDPQGWMRVDINGTDRYIPYW